MLSSRFKPWHVPLFLGEVRVADGVTRRPVLVHFEVTHALQRALRLLRLLEDAGAERANETQALRRRGAILQSDARHVHRRRAAAADAISRTSSPRSRRDPPQVRHAASRTAAMLTPERAQLALGRRRQSVQHLARLPRRAARRGARHSRPHGEDPRHGRARCARAASTTSASTRSSRTTTSTRSCPIVQRAAELGVGVNFSVYTDFKNGNRDHLVQDEAVRSRSTRSSASCWRSSVAGAASSRTPTTTSSRFRATCAAS